MIINWKITEERMNFSIPFISLSVVFTVLKLFKVIAWSWWLVFSPVLILITMIVGLIVMTLLILLFAKDY